MNIAVCSRPIPRVLTGTAVALIWLAFARAAPVAVAASPEAEDATAAAAVNLAVVAKPSGSYVSGDTSLAALNDGHAPKTSHVRGRGAGVTSTGALSGPGWAWLSFSISDIVRRSFRGAISPRAARSRDGR